MKATIFHSDIEIDLIFVKIVRYIVNGIVVGGVLVVDEDIFVVGVLYQYVVCEKVVVGEHQR